MGTPICTICARNLFGASSYDCRVLECGHVFHKEWYTVILKLFNSLSTWFTFSTSCPTCKMFIDEDCYSTELKFTVKRENKDDNEDLDLQTDTPNPLDAVSERIKKYQTELENVSDPLARIKLHYCIYEELQAYFTSSKRKFTAKD